MSIQARAVNPATSFRSGAAGRVQAMLFVIYPVASIPAGLAYIARWATGSEAAFFGVLAFDALVAMIVYRIALQSAAEAAERLKESMIAALSAGEGPIAKLGYLLSFISFGKLTGCPLAGPPVFSE